METDAEYTVKQLAALAGVSVRTLHYYDQIHLIEPSYIGENGYRHYNHQQLLLLQQVLFFRELDFSLNQIKEILSQPQVDLVQLLETHKLTLTSKVKHIHTLLLTIDSTIESLKGKTKMTDNDYFKGFSEEKQSEYQKYAEEHWDKKLVDQSNRRWKNMTKSEKDTLLADGERITLAIVGAIPHGAASREVQALVGQWHGYINRFYDCSFEILLGLGKAYTEHPDFIAFYRKIHPSMPEFLYEAIKVYCADHGVQGKKNFSRLDNNSRELFLLTKST